MPELTIDGARVHCLMAGEGPRTILFLHGGLGYGAGLWRAALAALPAGWRGIALDNFAHSDPPPGGYTVPAFARRVRGVIAALGGAPVVLCGHSMGGVVSQRVALDAPDRVAGLVLVATGPSVRNHGIALQLLATLEAHGATRETMTAIGRNWYAALPDPRVFDDYVAGALQAPLAGMVEAQRSLLATDLEPELPRIGCPALVVHGALDRGRTIDHAERLVKGIPASELVVFETSGHTPMWEVPEAFHAALARFLAARAA